MTFVGTGGGAGIIKLLLFILLLSLLILGLMYLWMNRNPGQLRKADEPYVRNDNF